MTAPNPRYHSPDLLFSCCLYSPLPACLPIPRHTCTLLDCSAEYSCNRCEGHTSVSQAPPPQPHPVNLAFPAAPLLSWTLRPYPLHSSDQTSPAQLCPSILQLLGRQASPSNLQQLNDTLMPAMKQC